MHRIHRGISEYVSAVILAMIVLSAGALLFIYASSSYDRYYRDLEREILRSERELAQSIAVSFSYIDSSGYVVIAMTSSFFPVKILSIYIDNGLASCSITIGSNTYTLPGDQLVIPPRSIAIARCGPIAKDRASVKIVFEGGIIEVMAQKV